MKIKKNNMYRFIIDSREYTPKGKYGVIPIIGLTTYLMDSWEYFLHKKREGVDIKVSKDRTKVTLLIDQCYCIICNDLLRIQRKCPQCLKMGKEATEWLNNYKNICRGKG